MLEVKLCKTFAARKRMMDGKLPFAMQLPEESMLFPVI